MHCGKTKSRFQGPYGLELLPCSLASGSLTAAAIIIITKRSSFTYIVPGRNMLQLMLLIVNYSYWPASFDVSAQTENGTVWEEDWHSDTVYWTPKPITPIPLPWNSPHNEELTFQLRLNHELEVRIEQNAQMYSFFLTLFFCCTAFSVGSFFGNFIWCCYIHWKV